MGVIALPAGASVYVDAQVIIYTVERRSSFAVPLDLFWSRVVRGDFLASSSEFSYLECLVRPLREQASVITDRTDYFFAAGAMRVHPVSRPVLRAAAELRAAAPALKSPDAIHIATAQLAGCSHFLTNDLRLLGLTPMPSLTPSNLETPP